MAVPLAMMPGAPPVRLVSVAVITVAPFSPKVRVVAVAVRLSWVPAAKAPLA